MANFSPHRRWGLGVGRFSKKSSIGGHRVHGVAAPLCAPPFYFTIILLLFLLIFYFCVPFAPCARPRVPWPPWLLPFENLPTPRPHRHAGISRFSACPTCALRPLCASRADSPPPPSWDHFSTKVFLRKHQSYPPLLAHFYDFIGKSVQFFGKKRGRRWKDSELAFSQLPTFLETPVLALFLRSFYTFPGKSPCKRAHAHRM